MSARVPRVVPAVVAAMTFLGCASKIGEAPMAEAVVIVPLGQPGEAALRRVEAALRATYGVSVVRAAARPLPRKAFRQARRRYWAPAVLTYLRRETKRRVIGIADRDMAARLDGRRKDWGVMGFAEMPGRAAVVSTFRAKGHVGLLAAHEYGHTLGLPHCPDPLCLMRDGGDRGAMTASRGRLCPGCREKGLGR